MATNSALKPEMADRLNNILTGIAIRCGVLEELASYSMKRQLSEMRLLANEAVQITRILIPNGDCVRK